MKYLEYEAIVEIFLFLRKFSRADSLAVILIMNF